MKKYLKPTIVVLALVLMCAIAAPAVFTAARAEEAQGDIDADKAVNINSDEINDISDAVEAEEQNDEMLFHDSSDTILIDIDNDGKADSITYENIGKNGETTIIYVKFGDTSKDVIRREIYSGLTQPQIRVIKRGDDNLICLKGKLYDNSLEIGNEDDEFIYCLTCNTEVNVMLGDYVLTFSKDA